MGDNFFEIIHWSSGRNLSSSCVKHLNLDTQRIRVGGDLREAVNNMKTDHAKLFRIVLRFSKWLGRTQELQEAEQELHSNMPSHLAAIMKGKKEILVDLKYPDSGVIDEATSALPSI